MRRTEGALNFDSTVGVSVSYFFSLAPARLIKQQPIFYCCNLIRPTISIAALYQMIGFYRFRFL